MMLTMIMTRTHLSSLDLNLLLALDALLQERHVTRAASRMSLTQSAMSRALARLRATFDDPILVRSGRGMVLSPRAHALAAPLRRALDELDVIVGERPSFDPASAARTFQIATVDYAASLVLPALLARLAQEAPRVNLAIQPIPQDIDAALEGGTLDLVVAPRRRSAPGLVWRRIYSEPFVTLVREGHPGVGKALTLHQFCSLPHIVVAPEGRPGSNVDDALTRRGLQRRVALRLPSFLTAPLLVAQSDLILTTTESLARRFAELLPLRVLVPPVPLAPCTLAIAWHEKQRADPAHAWLRHAIAEAAASLAPSPEDRRLRRRDATSGALRSGG